MNEREEPRSPWCGGPPALAGAAMEEWVALLRRRRPWDEMPLDDVAGMFRLVLLQLLRSDDDFSPDVRAARLRRISREHGAYRRRQGVPAFVLTEEIATTMDVVADVLARGGVRPDVVARFQDSLAPVMRAVERAAYSGYVDWDIR